jgi:NADPH2:quinone reductase
MRAIVLTGAGGPEVLHEEERPTPEPGPGEIRVRVRTSALNRADLLQRRGHYPAPPGVPADIPGMEYAGEVDALGPGVSSWSTGARVMGLVGGGGHARHVVVHAREAVAIPDVLGWEEAAAVPEVFFTAWDALSARLCVTLGDRVLIHAVGSGVGTAALQLARACGATVVGTSRTASKLAAARGLGLEHAIDASSPDWPDQVLAATGGVDAVVDLVGGAYFAGNLRVLAPRGRLCVVGLVAGARAEIDLGLLLAKRLQIVGTVLRARPLEEKITLAQSFSRSVLPMLASGRVRPIVHRVYPFSEVRAAHEALEAGESFGKIVLRWEV